MSDFIDISFLGDKELQRKLKRLEIQTQRKIVRAEMRKSMKQVKDRAQALVPVDTGNLRRSIHQKQRTKRGITRAFVATGTREQLGIPANERGYYPASIEFGARSIGIEENSYLRRALNENKASVLKDMADGVGKGIEREAKK